MNSQVHKVMFRKQPVTGKVIAIFPEKPWDFNVSKCEVIMENGVKIGLTFWDIYNTSKPASPEEYKDLKLLIERISYPKLEVQGVDINTAYLSRGRIIADWLSR